MESVEEDLSARVLLRNVLQAEAPRSPVTRSRSREQLVSRVRRTSRGKDSSVLQTPQLALRHKLKQKLHKSATQSPVLHSKRPRSLGRKAEALSGAADVTPRSLLRGFIQTEAETSLLVSGQPALPTSHLQHAETSIHSNRESEGGSRFDLPDLATEPLSHVIRGMSRRRPPPTFNVSAFEKQLNQKSGEGEESHENTDMTQGQWEQDLSAGSRSVLSLSLKTPFVNVRSERAGLRRKAAQRKKPSVNDFDEAVEKRLERHHSQDYTVVQARQTPASHSLQEFTLGLSSVVMSNTELYGQLAGPASELSMEDGGAQEAEGKENQEVVDKQTEHLIEIPKTQPEPLQEMEPSSESLHEEVMETEEIALALQSQEKEARESEMDRTDVEGVALRVGEKEELPTQLSEQISQQTYYYSEGGVIVPGVTASGRSMNSVGADLPITENELHSFTGASLVESPVLEEPCPSSASSTISRTPKPPSPGTHQTSTEEGQDDEREGVTETNLNKSVITDVDVSQSEDEIETSLADLSPVLHSLAPEDEENVEEDEEDAQSEELSMQTPAFIRQRKEVSSPRALASPTVLATIRAGSARKPRPRPKPRTAGPDSVLPKSYVMSVFKHFAKTRVASDVYPVINEILQKYFSRLADDLEVYSAHAKRKTIEVEDVELLMKRQGFVTDSTPLNVLIEKFLPLEYRKILIPVAASGNKLIPSQRR